jgi:hypothetical protein
MYTKTPFIKKKKTKMMQVTQVSDAQINIIVHNNNDNTIDDDNNNNNNNNNNHYVNTRVQGVHNVQVFREEFRAFARAVANQENTRMIINDTYEMIFLANRSHVLVMSRDFGINRHNVVASVGTAVCFLRCALLFFV